MDKEDISPPDVKITSEEMEGRIGFEPEYSTMTYFCPYCFYKIPETEVDDQICKLDLGNKAEEEE
ncbi:MAG: hypothetical protein ABR958_09310 [Dehalococcoidales bacterium]